MSQSKAEELFYALDGIYYRDDYNDKDAHADIAKIVVALDAARREQAEQDAQIADKHCRYCSRLCIHGIEDLCTACEIAAAIRQAAEGGKP